MSLDFTASVSHEQLGNGLKLTFICIEKKSERTIIIAKRLFC